MRYKAVQIPEEMFEKIKELIEGNPGLGYPSVRSFIEDAVYRHVRQLNKVIHLLKENTNERYCEKEGSNS
ncbi:MAG: hypothetical protein J7L11_02860 [Thermoprotei archaeon]|nr:hypothetical protein [Thermoprotei archaeon]